jgi:DegV family protein with EDD domain
LAVVRIVTDSTADLEPAQQREFEITVVPLNVHFGDQVFRDRVDLSGEEFFRRLRTAQQLPRTSQPSVGSFEDAFRRIRDRGDDVVAVHLSSKVSGTYNAALMAADSVDKQHIDVVDSETASMALGFLALEAAERAKGGAAREQVRAHVESLVPKAKLLCGIDTLHYLEKGGRIGRARALLGSLLNVKPMVTLKDGAVEPLGRARSRTQLVDRLVQLLTREGKLSRLAVLHGAALQDAEKLRERVRPSYPHLEISLTEVGPVLGTHTGPGVIGFTYLLA